MSQSRLGSFIEAWINVLIGFTINFIANLVIFPIFGWQITVMENLALGAVYTLISVARSYAIRRWFNARIRKAAMKIAREA
jgi:hypothetical protein